MHAANHITPVWNAPAQVRALFTTRCGGHSAAPYNSFNLGSHVHDALSAVAANRALHHELMHHTPTAYLEQVHATDTVELTPETIETAANTTSPIVADAAYTRAPQLACTVMVADCLPVLFTNAEGTLVAAAHAGWRGLAAGVLERTVAAMRDVDAGSSDSNHILAWLGPCIGPQHFEVGTEVRDAFVHAGSNHAETSAAFTPAPLSAGGKAQDPKFLANLPLLARQRLRDVGVTAISGNDGSLPWCTYAQEAQYFSHRRDSATLGATGRMAASIWIAPPCA